MAESRIDRDVRGVVAMVMGNSHHAFGESPYSLISGSGSGFKSHEKIFSTTQGGVAGMFRSRVGTIALSTEQNVDMAWSSLSLVGIECLFSALETHLHYRMPAIYSRKSSRALSVAPDGDGPGVLMLLDSSINDISRSRIITNEIYISGHDFLYTWTQLRSAEINWHRQPLLRALLAEGPDIILEILEVTRPEVILSRLPRMIPACSPSPALVVESCGQNSSAGIFCRDSENVFGLTACYHGTGPVGTPVTVGLRESVVKHADRVQDIVFIPLDEGFNLPTLRGLSGVLIDRPPAQTAHVTFDGATTGPARTRISSHDAGLLRPRPEVQLKVQTPADTNSGDSGCALIDEGDNVIGFAFQRSDYDDFPQITDWIWAANALRALGLTPV